MKRFGDIMPPSPKQMMYLRDLLRAAHVDEITTKKIIKKCVTGTDASHQIQAAIKLKQEYDRKFYERMPKPNASNRRQK